MIIVKISTKKEEVGGNSVRLNKASARGSYEDQIVIDYVKITIENLIRDKELYYSINDVIVV